MTALIASQDVPNARSMAPKKTQLNDLFMTKDKSIDMLYGLALGA